MSQICRRLFLTIYMPLPIRVLPWLTQFWVGLYCYLVLSTKPNIKHSTGPTANIRSINATDLRNYLDNHYKSGRIVVAGAGGVCHEDLVKLAECNLGQLSECRFRVKKRNYSNSWWISDNTYPGEIPRLTPCRFTGSEIRVRDDSLPLAHIAIAVEGAGWSDPDTLTLMVASTLLGAWDRSQASAKQNATSLARASAEEDLCHSFQSFNTCYKVSSS